MWEHLKDGNGVPASGWYKASFTKTQRVRITEQCTDFDDKFMTCGIFLIFLTMRQLKPFDPFHSQQQICCQWFAFHPSYAGGLESKFGPETG
jgi:hypothetical protein